MITPTGSSKPVAIRSIEVVGEVPTRILPVVSEKSGSAWLFPSLVQGSLQRPYLIDGVSLSLATITAEGHATAREDSLKLVGHAIRMNEQAQLKAIRETEKIDLPTNMDALSVVDKQDPKIFLVAFEHLPADQQSKSGTRPKTRHQASPDRCRAITRANPRARNEVSEQRQRRVCGDNGCCQIPKAARPRFRCSQDSPCSHCSHFSHGSGS